MIIKPKIRGFICTNAHPVGCESLVASQISFIKSQQFDQQSAPKNVLVLGCSTGYGLASRITAAYGYGANTVGVCFEKTPTEKKTGTAGWYNTAAFHKFATADGLAHQTFNGDAFGDEMKQQIIEYAKAQGIQFDLIVYSLASPRRTDPEIGTVYKSTLKPVGSAYSTKTYDTDKDLVHTVDLEPANEEEIHDTIKVMGGEDWERWVKQLADADLLAQGCKTTAYTYIGKELTWPIYGQATIGKAKEDLDRAAAAINSTYSQLSLDAHVSSLKALVTQASSAIPVMPLYISLIYRVMKDQGTHEGCIEQINGLFSECLYSSSPTMDEMNRYRMDGKETNDNTQSLIKTLWDQVTQENFHQLSDYEGYHQDFLNLFGFGVEGVDYEEDVSPNVSW
jgi:enoyl-[acyl-carrier protein] reductase/trans-2-enoyl-CoA reductase (NAD+)